jgi:hypothetical protein
MTDLNEKLARLRGWKLYDENDRHTSRISPDGKLNFDWPDYTHDLTACFRDIKPLLVEREICEIKFSFYNINMVTCWLRRVGESQPIAVDAKTDALAFCEAAIKFLSE